MRPIFFALALAAISAPRVALAQSADVPQFRRLVFESDGATLSVQPSGDFTVEYPDPAIPGSGILDLIGLAPMKTVKGTLTPTERSAIEGIVSAPDALGYESPVSDAQVQSGRPFSIELERPSDREGLGLAWKNSGEKTTHYPLANFADLLNGVVDRATNGYVYGDRLSSIEGTIGYGKDDQGRAVVTLTDPHGYVYQLNENALVNVNGPGVLDLRNKHKNDADSPEATADARALLGTKVTVHVLTQYLDGTRPRQLAIARAVERNDVATPAADPERPAVGFTQSLGGLGR